MVNDEVKEMLAVIISMHGSADVLKSVVRPIPVPGSLQVLVKVKAAGVNRPDIAQRKGTYPPPKGAPQDIPGLEIAGVVESCGEAVTLWKPGDHVCALVAGGGYAEYAVAHEGHCLPIPTGWDFIEAASLPETVFTVWHNVFQRGRLKPGESLLVHGGSSGIGITAIQLAKLLGSEVFVTAGSAEKCRECINLGADVAVNYMEEDFEDRLKDEGVDVILDMIGGDYTAKNLRLLKNDGRLVFINGMEGSKGEFDIWQIMKNRLTITGSTLRAREDSFKTALAQEIRTEVWPLLETGAFQPVVYANFLLEQANQAHELMESSKHIGKIVLVSK